ncbi:MAG: lamin tail domain-containing protein [Bacteroidia bacterium]|nr:lamin tail domain-containing protein [Bacteroidia bacterium]
MKKIYKTIAATLFCFVATITVFGQTTDLLISEYIEGTSFNKSIEIYNGTGTPVDLSHYSLQKDVNGNGVFGNTFTFSGVLNDNDVFVISNSQADPLILAVSDTTNDAVINFNGNDQVMLLKDGIEIDRLGISGGADFAKDMTLVRKVIICSPASGEQNPATNGQWDSYTANTFSYLGFHTSDCSIGPSTLAEILSFEITEQLTPAVINSMTATVAVNVLEGTNITNLTPLITISNGATMVPASGVPQNFTNPVLYTVTAEDGITTKIWTVTVNTISFNTVTIYNIQYSTDSTGNSPLTGDTIMTSGIVTSLHYSYAGGTYRGYFIQESEGAWHGIYVYDNAHTPAIGDNLTIIAKVAEYNGLTELSNVLSYNVNSTGNSLPLATVINTGDMNEEYEGVLITVENAECINDSAGHSCYIRILLINIFFSIIQEV